MPVITPTSLAALGAIDVTETTLDGATDVLVYKRGAILTLRNEIGRASCRERV